MPELPEVETVRRGLAPVLVGARLTRVEARRPDLRFPLPEGFVQRLTGARIKALERRAKYLLAPLDRGDTLVMHLGMTGRFEIEFSSDDLAARSSPGGWRPGDFVHAPPADPKHAHVVFETDRRALITYSDPRRFGFMGLIASDALGDHAWFTGLGPEPLGAGFTGAYLAGAFEGRRQNVKTSLLDQRLVAGLGNIYVCEALHRAHISPNRLAGDLSKAERGRLVEAVRAVLTEAIDAGGSTLRDYAGADGALGYFQHSFRAYGRQHQPCATANCRGVIARIVQSGRSSFFCPLCQR